MLHNKINQKLLNHIDKLPINPEVATKVMNLAEDGLDISFKELENIIKLDPGLTTKILKVANSALYARPHEIKSLQLAITLLGFRNIKSLVLLVTASSFLKGEKNTSFYKSFWTHSIITAFLAKSFMNRCNMRSSSENAFLCGLLHNMGKAVLFTSDRDKYGEVLKLQETGEETCEEYEEKMFEANHKLSGAALFEKWNFPDLFVDVALEHNSPNITSKHKTIIIYVSIANLLTSKLGYGKLTSYGEKLLHQIIPHTCLSEKDIESYEKEFINLLQKDPLFIECQNLYSIK
ncbi:MAG: HDOD domain-containing protein [Spirochaetales bacterium]|nr:HDOD domain-containing protein [Spirochaetales bacterium]